MQKINNIHDKNFYQLVDSISNLNEEELLFKIKFNFFLKLILYNHLLNILHS